MFTAVLTALTVGLLFFGAAPLPGLVFVCCAIAAVLFCLGGHRHGAILVVDQLAQRSPLSQVSPDLKLWGALLSLLICVASPSSAVGIYLTLAAFGMLIARGSISAKQYVRLLAVPLTFLTLGGLALLFEWLPRPVGVVQIPFFSGWLCVGPANQAVASLVMARALGAVSCLYFVSLTTPMPGIIGALRRARCPELLITLMYLIYRYIFLLLALYHTMHNAAQSRLGFVGYRTGLRTTASLYVQLLAQSYRRANQNFDAIESRCFDTEMRFLEPFWPITPIQVCMTALPPLGALMLIIVTR